MTSNTDNVSRIELAIVTATIDGILADEFNTIRVSDGEEFVSPWTRDRAAILAAMFGTGEDTLHFRNADGRRGSVLFIYGNGCDVISDYSVGDFTDESLKQGIAAADQATAA